MALHREPWCRMSRCRRSLQGRLKRWLLRVGEEAGGWIFSKYRTKETTEEARAFLPSSEPDKDELQTVVIH